MNFEDMIAHVEMFPLPPLVVYIGSTGKCGKQFERAQLYDTIRPDPRMFLTIGCTMMSDDQLVQQDVRIDKDALDLLHFRKIFLAAYTAKMQGVPGEVCLLDLTDKGTLYIGESTNRELRYAKFLIDQDYPLTIRVWSQEQEQVRKVLKDLVLA